MFETVNLIILLYNIILKYLERYKMQEMTDKLQYNDPLYHLFTEVEHPEALRNVLRKWRSGAEIKFKMPYYPQAKKPNDSLRF